MKDYVPAEDYIKPFDDAKIVPFATHLKTKVDGFGKTFPEGWRQLIAGDNAEHMKTLERFQSPKALYESYGALRAKMASGELKAIEPFPEKGTDEQKNAWRATNGIPASHEEYTKALKLGEGLKLESDDDKAVIDSFAKDAHAQNIPPTAFNATVNWFLRTKGERMTARAEQHDGQRVEAEDALRAEWQADYRGNINRLTALKDVLPKEVSEAVFGGQDASGRMLLNNPAVAKWLVDYSRMLNPAGTLLPGGGEGQIKGIEDEIKGIEKTMRTDRAAYNKDEKMQGRYRELLGAFEKLKGQPWGQRAA